MARNKQVPISSMNTRAARQAHAKARQKFKTYDTSAIRPKRSKTPFVVLAVVIVAIIVAAVFIVQALNPPKVDLLPRGEEAVVVVTPGEGAKEIADNLVEARLIGTAGAFTDIVNQKNAASSLIPGSYTFHGGDTPETILNALLAGPASTGDSLTIPEGFTREQVSIALESATNGRLKAKQFMDATSDASQYASAFSFVSEAGNNNLEGFLFPKTYTITATDDISNVVAMMLNQYSLETANLDWGYPEAAGLSKYDTLILASIVEKEASADNMATVASVFYNRLASDRPYLESDATTAYEVGHDPTAEEVHADTPYSTYTNSGLPPTPICNPSLAALQAVCSPEETDYMYFYFEDGKYTFSSTYEDHQNAFS